MKSTSIMLTFLVAFLSLSIALLDTISTPREQKEDINVSFEEEGEHRVGTLDDTTQTAELSQVHDIRLDLKSKEELETDTHINLASALAAANQGDVTSAERIYRALLNANPNHQAAAINLGLLLKKAERYDEALAILTPMSSRATGKRKGKVLALLADTYGRLGHHTKSAELFQKSIEYRPSHKLSWINLAKAQQMAGKPWRLVSKTFRQAVALDPNKTRTRLRAAEYEFLALNPKRTIKLIKEKYSRLSSRELARSLLAWSYLLQGKNKKSQVHFNWLVQHGKPEFRQHYVELISFLSGGTKVALKPLLEIRMNSFPMLKQYVLMLSANDLSKQSNQLKASLKLYEELLDMPVYAGELAGEAAAVAQKLELGELALSLLEKAIGDKPASVKLIRQKARLHLSLGNVHLARSVMEEVYSKNNASTMNRRVWAEILIAEGQYPNAIRVLSEISDSVKNQRDWYHLAMAHARVGDILASNQALSFLLELNGKHVSARILLAKNLCKTRQFEACKRQHRVVLKLDENNEDAIGLVQEFPQLAFVSDPS